MKTASAKTDSQNLARLVPAARLRVATAENRWQAAKQQARAAKRRRKEVKIIARHARKQAKQAKADLAEARKALAAAEAKLAQSGIRGANKKPVKAKARTKPVAKRALAAPKKKAMPARQRPKTPSVPPPTPEPAAQVTSSIPEIQPRNESGPVEI